MTAMEQIELISVEARKLGMKYGEYVEKYGHTLPKPEPTKYKERAYYEGIEYKKYKPREKVERLCEECGVTFLASIKSARRCPVCSKERRRKLSAERNRQRRKASEEVAQVRK